MFPFVSQPIRQALLDTGTKMAVLQMRTLRTQRSVVECQLRARDEHSDVGFGTQGFGMIVESFSGEVTHFVGVGAYTTLVALLQTARAHLSTGLKATARDSTSDLTYPQRLVSSCNSATQRRPG